MTDVARHESMRLFWRNASCALAPLVTLIACGGSVATSGPSSASDGGATGPKCTASPTLLVDGSALLSSDAGNVGISVAMDLAVSDEDLFVAVTYGDDQGALLRVPIRGGPAALLTPIAGEEIGLLVTGDSVVFVQAHAPSGGAYSGDVRIALQGGDTTVLASASLGAAASPRPNGMIVTDGQNVYFAAKDGTLSVPLAGGAVKTLTTHTGALAVVGSSVVVADTAAEGVFSVPIAGGPETML
ncbi:MAG TPA: hypothetical protein VHS09_14505, partial [Polyangiaceae bacterium]|nr:hypothetical protein [Polyangiaceae bacterium]